MTLSSQWPAQMETSDAVEDEVVVSRVDRARRGVGSRGQGLLNCWSVTHEA